MAKRRKIAKKAAKKAASKKSLTGLSAAKKIGIIIAALAAVGLVSAVAYPAVTGHAIIECEKVIQVPYEDIEYYTEKEPYSAEECNDVQVPYTDEECTSREESYPDEECTTQDLEFSMDGPYDFTFCIEEDAGKCIKETTWCYISVSNYDTVAGTWQYKMYFHLDEEKIDKGSLSKFISPFGTEWFDWDLEHEPGKTVTCELVEESIPTKEQCEIVIKYRTVEDCESVIKYKTVTECEDVVKYRDVEKSRTVTKLRDETIRSFSACFE